VWLPAPALAPWLTEWVAEVAGFPHLAHDDRADALAMALQRLRGTVEPYRWRCGEGRWRTGMRESGGRRW
jgi:hypothetical protein